MISSVALGAVAVWVSLVWCFLLFLLLIPPPPRSTLFPYTTLFRSRENGQLAGDGHGFLLYRIVQRAYQSLSRLGRDRKSTRLNSSHPSISYAVFCLKKKKIQSSRYVCTARSQAAATWSHPGQHAPD